METQNRGLMLPALDPRGVPARTGSSYPEPFAGQVAARSKRALGDALGLRNFGVNLVEMPPGVLSAMRHWHTRQDEFVMTVTEKLLTYALGRGVEYYDRPAIRDILREAELDDHRWSSIVLGIVKSTPFQMRMTARRSNQ